MTFAVHFSALADDDLARLLDFMIGKAQTSEDLDQAQAAIEAIRTVTRHQLATTPYSFRKAGISPTRRELIIPFGSTGYVALYEIVGPTNVLVLAVRHQCEEDFH